MNVTLTKDADKVICSIYKYYLERAKNGEEKDKAKYMGSSENIKTKLLQNMPQGDIDEAFRELGRKKLLQNLYADNTITFSVLTSDGIVYMENRFKNGLKEVAEFIGNFIP